MSVLYFLIIFLLLLLLTGDSINTSFDNSEDVSDTSETNKNSIVLTDVLLVVNKNRVSFLNNLINNYLESFKNLNLNFDKGFIETVSSAMGTETNTPELVKDDDSVEETTVDE